MTLAVFFYCCKIISKTGQEVVADKLENKVLRIGCKNTLEILVSIVKTNVLFLLHEA